MDRFLTYQIITSSSLLLLFREFKSCQKTDKNRKDRLRRAQALKITQWQTYITEEWILVIKLDSLKVGKVLK